MPVIEQLNYSGAQMAALSICIAGGSIVVSHVNDAGFWLFGKFTGATEAQTLKTDADGNYTRHYGCDCRDDCVYAAELTPVFFLTLWERVGVRASGRRDLILSGGGFALPDLQVTRFAPSPTGEEQP